MIDENRKNQAISTQEDVYKTAEYARYVFWHTIPSMLLKPPRNRDGSRPTPQEFADLLSIDDPRIVEYLGISTQIEFGERFGVSRQTLTEWNKLIAKRDALADLRAFFRGLSKNVMLAMYNLALSTKTPNADRAQLNFMKIIAEFNEKSVVEHTAGDNFFEGLKAALEQPHGNTDTTTPSIAASSVTEIPK